ncbi:FAD-dependent monooxygenase [Phytomonospora endophytica]|uniref:2-polyprenyl-6-methoxyphenol hydroxylase-like FAD-dependent oxidoreductase n=1 Tax=Phytomonospora endophytica TaxID=714109 RepID=A0A841FJS6_9ACTN|nr:FAD-dependent monooxygenase [Phytomonospora endophytica]MBB6037571.1 2-polyprenyl-6-methoxyphenol hydroxylase-like FAD-dependent oxidoreductase [Phytomonospora endophytica]
MDTNAKRALVVGLGVSGMASALRLHQAGWRVVICEKAPERRRGGYFIALFGTGISAARRLGIALPNRLSDDIRSYNVDRAGRRLRSLSFTEAVPGEALPVVRGDIEDGAFNALPADVEIRYSAPPLAIRQDADGVDVDFGGGTERFGLVVGADGLRSTVRRLAFGPDEGRVHRLGYMIAACELPGPVPGYRVKDGVILAEEGRSAWVFPFADRPPTVLFNYRTADPDAEFGRPPIETLREVFGPEAPGATLGWLLDRFGEAPDHLFDTAEQIRMDTWHRGRVVLLGDSAWCPTLYSGMGAATGLAGADLLGTMLERHPGDIGRALRAWEAKLRPFVEFHQGSGMDMRRLFLPADRTEMRVRKAMNRVMATSVGRALLSRVHHRSRSNVMKTVDIVQA